MRMGIDVARRTVGRPTRVTDAYRRIIIVSADDLLEIFDLADVFSDLDLTVHRKRDAGRIVTSVFKTFESVYDFFFCVF